MAPFDLSLGLIWYVVFLFSLTCHEAAHAWAAKRGGDLTAYRGGQVSLDPWPHIRQSPVGTVVVPILTFLLTGWMVGWASAPFDPGWQARHPRRAAWMALAGPLANLAIVIAAGLAIRLGMALELFDRPHDFQLAKAFTEIVAPTAMGLTSVLAKFLGILFVLNLLLMVFNLLPFPPLDGSTAIGLLVSEKTAVRVYEFIRHPAFSLIGLIIAWIMISKILKPTLSIAVALLYPEANYVWD